MTDSIFVRRQLCPVIMDIEGLLDLCLRFPWLIALEALIAFSRRESFRSYVDRYYSDAEYTGNRQGGGCKGEGSCHIRYLRLCCQSRFGEGYNFSSFFNVP